MTPPTQLAARITSLGAVLAAGLSVACATAAAASMPLPGTGAATPRPGNGGAMTLTARSTSAASGYAPTFTGNGLLGVRVPPAGQGYASGTVPTDSELAGFYAKPSRATAPERVQQRANLPTWSTLGLTVGGQTFSARRDAVSGYRQTLDLHTGIITTHARWRAPGGRIADLTYQVLTDRAREGVGLVRLTLRPRWSGTATVSDEIDGTPDTQVPTGTPVLTRQVAKSWNLAAREDELVVAALGTGIQATLASDLDVSANVTAPSRRADGRAAQSVGQRISFPVVNGHTYTFTKYVGVTDTDDGSATTLTARQQASSAAMTGWQRLLAGNRRAWAALWRGRIDVRGDRALATDVNASEFYLWSSTRSDEDWSVSPAGLSSNGYDGHIFWDAETWMFPSLLAQHPGLADAMESYRFQRLREAGALAKATGSAGARFPWESALTGTEQIPPPVSINSEGLYEQHITADIALAQWQYYLATGDRLWLATRGWPVISGAARFWASRATPAGGGREVIHHVTGPDEENPDVSDEAYTQVAAATTLRDAIAAAGLTGHHAPAAWGRIASGLERAVPVTDGLNPEFAGYQGQLVKQADVTLLSYPWDFRSSSATERADLDYYVPRTDPGGPSMDDAVSSIESEQLSPRSCQAFVYTERSYQPYLSDVFHQFSETRTGGAFTFMTGIGGFLQEFLYGYSGLRWESSSIHLSPGLSGPLTDVTLRDLQWRGRVFTLAVHRDRTTIALNRGAPLPVTTRSGRDTVRRGHPLTIRSVSAGGRPASRDAAFCRAADASSSAPGAPALAAVDGSPATDWQPATLPATLTVPVSSAHTISAVTIRWGQTWPPVLTPNVHPRPGPVRTLRARMYAVQLSGDGRRWRTFVRVADTGERTRDVIDLGAVRARYVRLVLLRGSGVRTVKTSSTPSTPILPMVQELTVGRS
jgi:trehalose/maltose hydrolase-like predicted phosphorylase